MFNFFNQKWRRVPVIWSNLFRPALGPTQPPIQWVTGVLSLGVKRPGREANHSPPSSAEIKNACGYISTPQYTFKAWCSVKKSRGPSLLLLYFTLIMMVRPDLKPVFITEWRITMFHTSSRLQCYHHLHWRNSQYPYRIQKRVLVSVVKRSQNILLYLSLFYVYRTKTDPL